MAGLWGNIVDAFSQGGVRGQQHQRFEEGIQKQQEEIAQQDALDRQREHDLNFHEALMGQGYKPAVNGMVREDYSDLPGMSAPAPSGGDLPGGVPLGSESVPAVPGKFILRPIDKTRQWAFKDHTGADVTYEQPTAMDQARFISQRGGPAREAEVQQREAINRAAVLGTGEGNTEAKTADLKARGVDLTDDQADLYGIPKGTRMLPEQLTQLTEKYNTVRGAGLRANATTTAAKSRAEAQAQIADARNQAIADRQQEKLKHQDAWQAVRTSLANQAEAGRNGRAARAESGRNSRVRQRIGVDEKLHGQWTDQAFAEEQKQLQAQALLDEKDEPGALFGTNHTTATPDGQEFTDPWSGKKMTMNYAQRLRLKNSLASSQSRVSSLRERADEIAQRYGLNQAGSVPAGATPASPAAPAAAPAAQKFKVGQTVYDKAGKPHKVTGYDKAGKVLTD